MQPKESKKLKFDQDEEQQEHDTVHFKMKKLSTKSSKDFECVLHTSDTY